MKLGSLKEGSRDGRLVVVSRDLKRAVRFHDGATTLQQAIENWDELEPELRAIYRLLNEGHHAEAFALDVEALASPLPRAYQFLDGSAYLNHAELVRKSRGAELPPTFYDDPMMYQAVSDGFYAPTDPIALASEDYGIDFEGEVAVIVDDVPMGIAAKDAGRHIKLVTLLNDVSLRALIPPELAKGFGFVIGKPTTAFAPVAVTPDELGDAWDGGKVSLPLLIERNGKQVGRANAGVDMDFDFPRLIAHAAQTRHLHAGTIIGSGTVSNRGDAAGYSCIAEIRAIETMKTGKPQTPFLKFGDRVRIEMKDASGASIFGAIDQTVAKYERP